MARDYALYEKPALRNPNFPIRISTVFSRKPGEVFQSHWHEEFEFLLFIKGEAIVGCGSTQHHVKEGDLIIVNSNELHYAQNLGNDLNYHCVIVDPVLLQGSTTDVCQVKYISPIKQNQILFTNKVKADSTISECISSLIEENKEKDIGYELAVKSLVYKLLVLLLRNHVDQVLDIRECNLRSKRLNQLNNILTYIELNYMNNITPKELASLANISEYYFCHLFKKTTGKPLGEYINQVRVSKAEFLLRTTDMTVTEIALLTGFNTSNYFSRIYSKLKNQPPSAVRK